MLAVICAGWVGLVVCRTRQMAELIDVSESEVRALGVRDLGSALALGLASDPRGAIGVRALFDLFDAARYGRGKPKVQAMPACVIAPPLSWLMTIAPVPQKTIKNVPINSAIYFFILI